MKKEILVLYYTQSGQLLDIAKNITKDIKDAENVNLNFYNIKLKEEFPFPWKKEKFLDVFPESFLQIPSELDDSENHILKQKYDLIIIAYQVWYLAPSIAINSFLKNSISKELLKNTPVITVIGCRNLWIMAQEKVKALLIKNNANLVGNIALVDRHVNHISVITIVQWMFTGVKKRFLGIFPKPGVSDKDILESEKFGKPILQALFKNDYSNLQEELLGLGAVKIKPFLITVDKRANLLFNKWAGLIFKEKKYTKRRFLLKLFNFYLLFAIWVIAPIVFLLYLLSYPFFYFKIKKDKIYYLSNSYKKE